MTIIGIIEIQGLCAVVDGGAEIHSVDFVADRIHYHCILRGFHVAYKRGSLAAWNYPPGRCCTPW